MIVKQQKEISNKNGHILIKLLKNYINWLAKPSHQGLIKIFSIKKNFFNTKWLYSNKSFKPNQNNKLNRKIV